MRVVRAVWYKEWMALRRRLLFPVGFSVALVILGASQPMLDARYIPIVAGLATSIMSLKFWEERGQGTLDTLLALPASARHIFLAKTSFSSAVGVALSLIALACTALLAMLGERPVDWTYLLAIPVVIAVTFGACNVVGYVMWSLSEQAAKVAQLGMFVVLGAGFASAFGGGLSIAAMAVISTGIFGVGLICVIAVNAERIVLNLD